MIEHLNRDCSCVSLDRTALAAALESNLGQPGLYSLVQQRNPHMFSASPVFVAHRHLDAMRAVVEAAQEVAALPGWRDAVCADLPAADRRLHASPGLFLGFDFHLEDGRISLIEINTNPGGALLSAALARAQRACSEEVRALVPDASAADAFEADVLAMFLREWTLAGRAGQPRSIVIVDDDPLAQYLYAEFLLYQRLFERAGIQAEIAAPTDLHCAGGRLWLGTAPVDMVYNRLTDFPLAQPGHAALRTAWEEGLAVVAPHPTAHALHADKRNLALLSDPQRLVAMGADPDAAAVLARHVPRTEIVSAENAERLWSARRGLFFKPWAGFGSRAAYRGAKLTRGVWADIVAGRYVAQALTPPGERHVGGDAAPQALKFDLRAFADGSRVLWFSARLYQGQTTNFRTPGGGFAPVFAGPDQPRPMP